MAADGGGARRRRGGVSAIMVGATCALLWGCGELDDARAVEATRSALAQDGMSDGGMMPPSDADGGEPELRCPMHVTADPRDATDRSGARVVWFSWTARDMVMPQSIIDWMDENELETAHDAWHETRRWDEFCGQSFASGDGCDFADEMRAENLWRAPMQQGGPGAGRAFLAMHRHMIMMLRTAFPKHAALFQGFSHIPRTRRDAQNPVPWKTPQWSDDNLTGFDVLEHIEDHLDMFPNEDELGIYMEAAVRWTPDEPVVSLDEPGAGTHAAMHNQWSVSQSTADLGSTTTSLRNATFWRIHGFIDDVWERYRAAKGLHDDDADYMRELDDECYGMYLLSPSHRAEHAGM